MRPRKRKGVRVSYSGRRRVLAAGNVLLALLIHQVLNRNTSKGSNGEIQFRTLVEQTETLRARTRADEIAEQSRENALVDIGGVVGIGGLVAAGQLGLVAALGLSLQDSHVLGNMEADLGVALVGNPVGVTNATSGGAHGGESSNSGSEAKTSGECELHCDRIALSVIRRLKMNCLEGLYKNSLGGESREKNQPWAMDVHALIVMALPLSLLFFQLLHSLAI